MFIKDDAVGMASTVTGKNQISIPIEVARKHGIRPGCRLEWLDSDDPDLLQARVIPDPRTLADRLRGRGRKYLREGQDPVGDLVRERATDADE
jgi:bifunctional DNA-binding transcriptional regulator/antitoxin component of YhaV-PrlF toxin-antitoxin module